MARDSELAVATKVAAGAPESEIEITPEMIHAGVSVIEGMSDDLSFRDLGPWEAEKLVVRVVRAVISASRVGNSEFADAKT
jgi:hypothetical protein